MAFIKNCLLMVIGMVIVSVTSIFMVNRCDEWICLSMLVIGLAMIGTGYFVEIFSNSEEK